LGYQVDGVVTGSMREFPRVILTTSPKGIGDSGKSIRMNRNARLLIGPLIEKSSSPAFAQPFEAI
jgi:hypothetical protein